MLTKIVYVLTSSLADSYLEQMWISIWSLRQVQPDAYIQVVTDRQTSETLSGTRAAWQPLVDSILAVDCPSVYNSLQRSRYLKTRLRSLISGDYLFVDTDTVFGAIKPTSTPVSSLSGIPLKHIVFMIFGITTGLRLLAKESIKTS